MDGLKGAIDAEGRLVVEAGGVLSGIRALFADEVFVKTLTADYEEGELERLIATFGGYQPTLHRFAQMALGRYLRNLPNGTVRDVTPSERDI